MKDYLLLETPKNRRVIIGSVAYWERQLESAEPPAVISVAQWWIPVWFIFSLSKAYVKYLIEPPQVVLLPLVYLLSNLVLYWMLTVQKGDEGGCCACLLTVWLSSLVSQKSDDKVVKKQFREAVCRHFVSQLKPHFQNGKFRSSVSCSLTSAPHSNSHYTHKHVATHLQCTHSLWGMMRILIPGVVF